MIFARSVNQLKGAADANWAKVSPDIFGALFEHSLGKEERHAYGAHYTSPADIMKIVKPTIVEPWKEQIESARTLARLQQLLERMRHYTVLDPACGSGNFLYLAYRELKSLEARILERMKEFASVDSGQHHFGFVTARQFYGIDINPFAIELAKVTMMIARKLAIDELHIHENALPLDNLDENFKAEDALIDELGNPRPWPRTDVIIGNPPFLGAKRLKPERGPDYVKRVRKAYPEVPGMADYCVYWIRKANSVLPPCSPEDPVAGRAGLVGTQNIRNNQSRVGGLDEVVKAGTIVEAVDNQPWSGEANVHVSIVNWAKTHDPSLVHYPRHLWYRLPKNGGLETRRSKGGNAAKEYELGLREAPAINSALSSQATVSAALVLSCNTDPQKVFNGQFPRHQGFVLSPEEAADMISRKQIDSVAGTGREVRRVREAALEQIKGGLRAVYRTLELPGKNPLKDAQSALDAAVLDAYGFSAKKDLLAQLLALNHEVARRIDAGEEVTAPGVPPAYGDPAPLITDDCIRP